MAILASTFTPTAGAQTRAHMLPARSAGAAHPAIANSAIVVRNISVLRATGAVEVHIEASGALNPVSGVLSHPDRIMVDLPNVNYDRSRRVEIGAGDIKDLRVALFKADPPVTRVVVDLDRPHPFTLLPDGNTVVLRITTAGPEAFRTATEPARPTPAGVPDGEPIQMPQASPDHKPAPVPQPKTNTAGATPPGPQRLPQQESTAPRPPAPDLAPPAEPPQVANLHLPPPPRSEPSLQPQDEEGDTTPHQAAKEKRRPIALHSVRVDRRQEDVEVHIETSREVQPMVSTAENGQRIILDFPGVTLREARRISVNAHGVQDVSASLYLLNPPVTRVVVNLTASRAYHLLIVGNTLTLRIGPKETQVGEKKD